MKNMKSISSLVLLFSLVNIGMAQLKEYGSYTITIPAEKGKRQGSEDNGHDNYTRGFEFKNGEITMYNLFYKNFQVIPKGKIGQSFSDELEYCPQLSVYKYNTNSLTQTHAIYPIFLGDYLGKPFFQYNLNDPVNYIVEKGGSETDVKKSTIMEKYPMVYPYASHSGSTISCNEHDEKTYNTNGGKPALVTYTYDISSVQRSNMKPSISEKEKIVECNPNFSFKYTLWTSSYNNDEETALYIYGERGVKKYKYSEYNKFHFAFFNTKGELKKDFVKEFEYLKGVEKCITVYDTETKKQTGFLVVLNCNPFMGMKKYKDPNRQKMYYLYLSSEGELIWEGDDVPTSEKDITIPIYSYKNGDAVYIVSWTGNFTKNVLVLSKLSKEGLKFEQHRTTNVIGDKNCRFQYTSRNESIFIPAGTKIIDNRLFVYGDQTRSVNETIEKKYGDQTVTETISINQYFSLNTINVDLEKNEIIAEYAAPKPPSQLENTSHIHDLIVNGNSLTFIGYTYRGTRADMNIDYTDNKQIADLGLMDNQYAISPLVYKFTETGFKVEEPVNDKFISLYQTGSYLINNDRIFFIGYLKSDNKLVTNYSILGTNIFK